MTNLMDLICNVDSHRSSIVKTFEKPNILYNLFDTDDRAWLEDFGRTQTPNSRRNDNGTLFTSGNFRSIINRYRRKLEQVLPGCSDSPDIDGNFFITPHQYGLHNDSIPKNKWQDNGSIDGEYHPWRNILIPLWQAPEDADSQILFFKQRDVDWAKVYKHKQTEQVATTYPVCRDYAEIDTFYDANGTHMPWQNKTMEPAEYMLHFDENIDRFRGLEVEIMFDWKPGMAFAFDSWQLHTTNKGNPAWHQKSGLLLCFFKKL